MKYIPLSNIKHINLAVREERNYLFASEQVLVEACLFELSEAISLAPIIFSKSKDGFKMCLLLGLEGNKNLFVNPEGQWMHSFIPAVLRVFPFKSAVSPDGKKFVCFQEGNNLLVSGDHGNRLFNDDGSASQFFNAYLKLFSEIDASSERTKKACAILDDFNLLEPYTIDLKRPDGAPLKVTEQWRINQEAFLGLKDSQYLDLRGMLPMIYAHFFSLRSYYNLIQMMGMREKSEATLKELGSKIFEYDDKGLEFNF